MVPDKDYYVDKDDHITDDPAKYAAQIATAGVYLDDRIAKRYGIGSGGDHLVAADEPGAVRRVAKGASEPQSTITKADDESGEETEAAEAAEAASPEVEETRTEAKKPVPQPKGAKKK